jgi:hypothetical protein
MKIYFFKDNRISIMEFAFPEDEPKDAIAVFEFSEGQSTFAQRYKVVNDQLVDSYPGKTDDEVDKILNDAEIKKAQDLLIQLFPEQAANNAAQQSNNSVASA